MANKLYEVLESRILLLDGGFGTMVQQYGFTEEDYRGERFRDWNVLLKGCNDLLAVTRPGAVREIHVKYLQAGADIIETDSFNANAVSLADYGLEAYAYEISRAAAGVARSAADEFTARNPLKPRFVAGSMGPTNRTASMSADVGHPAAREVTFTQLAEAYTEQARGLVDGGADVLLVETVFDTLNAKAALYAIDTLAAQLGRAIPVMISGTLADASGRTLSGQTVEAFYASVSHARLLSVGFNCAYGARQLMPYLERLAAVAEFRISAHPNAGLPNVMGGYDETPEMFARDVSEYMRRGLVNIVGGCCGTTPAHIFELAKIAGNYAPRPVPAPKHVTTLSGLEPLRIVPEANFVNVGERTNVAGSAKFARLIREGNYEEALSVARAQDDAGAQIVDVCMDDGLIDGAEAMRTFLNLMASEPEIARVPAMIDSSKWEVLVAGLQVTQGKAVVNSISLKEGEAEFLRRAQEIPRYGAAAVVMLFDERGQADTYERKTEVASRAYKLLTDAGFPAEDIIFDPNVLAVATGIPEHDSYAKAFIDATRWIKHNLPHAKVSGGVSNLSFAFRGNNAVREAMHSAFLYHAIRAGMDMGIVNPQMVRVYSEIEPELLERVEDVILCRRPDAAERLTEYAQQVRTVAQTQPQAPDAWRAGTLGERIGHAMLKGVADFIEQDALEGYETLGSPMAVIDTLLMPAMEHVGTLFGEGKMFLPQVVKTARVMKRAVAALTPYIEQGAAGVSNRAGKVLIATVKGDVHDIGKNIVAVVMACNGYEIKDLGVMVESQRIVDEAVAWGADCICLSGLITPSLDEMAHVCEELERRALRIPVIIGGATTSDLHTAVKIAPVYAGVVVHSPNASRNSQILAQLLGSDGALYADKVRTGQQAMRSEYEHAERTRNLIPIAEARKARKGAPPHRPVVPAHPGRMVFPDFDVADAEAYINVTFHREGIKQAVRPDGSVEWHVVRRRPGTVGISAAIQKKYDVEVVPHLICGGQSKYDIEDALIDLDFLGLHNVLALRGDKSQNEKFFMPHPQGHTHAVDLVRQIAAMNRGQFVDGEVEECHHSKFSIGVAGYPEMHEEAASPEADIACLKAKVDAGAEYVVTQLFYDNARFFDYVRRCREAGITVPIIPGIKPLSTVRHLTLLPQTFGCHIPEELGREVLRHKDDPKAVREIGTEWAVAQSRELVEAGVPVLHYYPMGKADNIIKIAKAIF